MASLPVRIAQGLILLLFVCPCEGVRKVASVSGLEASAQKSNNGLKHAAWQQQAAPVGASDPLALQPKGRLDWSNLTNAALSGGLALGAQALNSYMQPVQPGEQRDYWSNISRAVMAGGLAAGQTAINQNYPQGNLTNALLNSALLAGGNWMNSYMQPNAPSGVPGSPCNQSQWWQGIGRGLGNFGLNALVNYQQGNQTRPLLQRLRNASLQAFQAPMWQQQMAGYLQQLQPQYHNMLQQNPMQQLQQLDLMSVATALGVDPQQLGTLLSQTGGAQALLNKLPPAARSLVCRFMEQQGLAKTLQGCTESASAPAPSPSTRPQTNSVTA